MDPKWRHMTLREAYPWWVLGHVPAGDIPYCACNEMLAGHMEDEIVAIAALSQPTGWELDQVLPRAFARLGVATMSHKEAARAVVRERMREIAQEIVARKEKLRYGQGTLHYFSYEIYRAALEAGAFDEGSDVEEQVADTARAFLELAQTLDDHRERSSRARQVEDLTIEAAEALLAGRPSPARY